MRAPAPPPKLLSIQSYSCSPQSSRQWICLAVPDAKYTDYPATYCQVSNRFIALQPAPRAQSVRGGGGGGGGGGYGRSSTHDSLVCCD